MVFNTRIAPSPTGDMHIGTARTAYFNWLAARASGGKFLLRIDDTDLARSDATYSQVILDTMAWLGLDYDGLLYQSQRFDIYNKAAEKLIDFGLARLQDGAVILFPQKIPYQWHDDLSGFIPITDDDKTNMSKGIVLLKSDGSPTYHFASVVDDIETDINWVIRGVDHITNTARQVCIYAAFGKQLPKYCHVGLIHKDKKKLSKRDGAASMLWYRDNGYDPDAMLNFMGRMGWGPTVDDRSASLLPRERMLELFLSGGQMRNASSNMDMDKLDWFNKKYKAKKVIQ